uniref:Enoyl-CoA hydratase, mitochondrial (inferred by orthology to a human protein) n=1 Tax=Strongyloides venezuelensis TaxID=75913 RepID=A0A0K0G0A9_STRVS
MFLSIYRNAIARNSSIVIKEVVGNKNDIALITLNSPRTFNSLGKALMTELEDLCKEAENDPSINCILLTSSSIKAFSQGADIKEISQYTYEKIVSEDFPKQWYFLSDIKKTKVALVNGICYGGGLELAMMCDYIFGTKHSHYALPEIKLGIIPGCGGTQRLPKKIGKSLAMEMILTGDKITADEAYKAGLLTTILHSTPEKPLAEAIKYIETNNIYNKYT